MLTALKTILGYHELIANFAAREIKAKYKQAALGVTWTILQPLLQMLILTLVFSYFVRVPSEGYPYAIFLFCGLLPWLFFTGAVSRGTSSLVNLRALITKIYFPRETLVLAGLIAAIVDLVFSSAVFIGLVAYFHLPVTWHWLWIIPIFAMQVTLVLGFMLVLAPLNAVYRDVGQMVPLLLQMLMYLTPVMYPASMVPRHLHTLYFLNPMACLIEAYRDVMLRAQLPDLNHMAYVLVISLVTLVLGYMYFKRVEISIADVA